jgi:ankyrin repeat/BTB/POZ domain-containing protein 1
VLAARSPYFRKKLRSETSSFKLPVNIPSQSFEVAIKYVYLSELPNDVGGGPGTGFSEEDVLEGLDKISRQLEIPSLWDSILEKNNKRLARQYRTQETDRARTQFEAWFQESVVQHRIEVDSSKADDIKWDRENSIYADVLLRADDEHEDEGTHPSGQQHVMSSIPVGPLHAADQAPNVRRSTLFPVHRAMLLRSEYFEAMFSSSFLEAQETPHLKIVPIECSPEVLEAVLRYLYTEKTDFHLDIAIEVLFAADLLLIERLKTKAALVIRYVHIGMTLVVALSRATFRLAFKARHMDCLPAPLSLAVTYTR